MVVKVYSGGFCPGGYRDVVVDVESRGLSNAIVLSSLTVRLID